MSLAKRKMRPAGRSAQQKVISLTTELLFVRHAPSDPPGKLYGRTDVPADVTNGAEIAAVRQAAGAVTRWISSPAVRCRQTLAAIWGDEAPTTEDPRLWEQNFGEWDGLAHEQVPDIGELMPAALADHCPPGGESFRDVCRRVHPKLRDVVAQAQGNRVAIVAHAGVVRAAIALALDASKYDAPALALSFDVQPLSLTVLRVLAPNTMTITCTNWRPLCV